MWELVGGVGYDAEHWHISRRYKGLRLSSHLRRRTSYLAGNYPATAREGPTRENAMGAAAALQMLQHFVSARSNSASGALVVRGKKSSGTTENDD